MSDSTLHLPLELISCVFDQCDPYTVVQAACVSQRWRSVARTHARFYYPAYVNWDNWTSRPQSILAAGLPVALSVQAHKGWLNTDFTPLANIVPLTRALAVFGRSSPDLGPFMSRFETSRVEFLERLEVESTGNRPSNWKWPTDLFAGHAPRLKHLKLWMVAPPCASLLAFRAVRHLDIGICKPCNLDLASAFPALQTFVSCISAVLGPDAFKIGTHVRSIELYESSRFSLADSMSNRELARLFKLADLTRVARTALYLNNYGDPDADYSQIDCNIFLSGMPVDLSVEFCIMQHPRELYLALFDRNNEKRRRWTWSDPEGVDTLEHAWITQFRSISTRIVELSIDASLLNQLFEFTGSDGLPVLKQLAISFACRKPDQGVGLLDLIPNVSVPVVCPRLDVLWLQSGHRFCDTIATTRIKGDDVMALLQMLACDQDHLPKVQLWLTGVALDQTEGLLAAFNAVDVKVSAWSAAP